MSRPDCLLPRPRVLLVEDDPDQASLLSLLLDQEGFETRTAPNGAAALELLSSDHPDALVTDIRMPLLDGYQLCRLIKDDPETATLPVVLLTSFQAKGRRVWAKVCGADLFLDKDQAAQELPQCLRRLLAAQPKASLPGRAVGGTFAELSIDAIQRRLALALEHRLLESALRGAVTQLGFRYRDLAGMVTGFLELVEDLVPGGLVYLLQPREEDLLLRLRGPEALIQAHGPALEQRFAKLGRTLQVSHEPIEDESVPGTIGSVEFNLGMGNGDATRAWWGCLAAPEALAESAAELRVVAEEFRPLFSGAHALARLDFSNTQLKEAGIRQTLLLDTLSHELRSPITALRLREEQVLALPGGLSPQAAEILISNRRVFDRLMRMLNGFLELEKLHQGEPAELIPLELGPLIADQMDDFRVLAQAKGLEIQLQVEEECQVQANADRVIQCLTNLVANAIVHSPERGKIMINAGLKGRMATIRIHDQGPGVPDSFVGNLFQPFQQVQKREGGVGLGLAITDALARSMGGRVSHQPTRIGACFQLDLETVPLD